MGNLYEDYDTSASTDTGKFSHNDFLSNSDPLNYIYQNEDQIPLHNIKQDLLKSLTVKPKGKYKHFDRIDSGGMKDIIKVRDADTARDLAMAILAEDTAEQESYMARFVYEARITANLEHPNIVPIHDMGVDEGGHPYFTMKLIEGENLASVLMSLATGEEGYHKKYTINHLLTIFINICNAISFAHSKGIIHLDLKPENIQIGHYGEVLVLDWGIAKILKEENEDIKENTPTLTGYKSTLTHIPEENVENTMDGEIKGTPGYMAPEQAAGINSRKNKSTDIYSLGAILYSMLTLKKPITGSDIKSILRKTIRGDVINPLDRAPERHIPKPLAAIVMKAMSLKQSDRYSRVKELIKDIDAYISNFATTAENAGLFKHTRLFIRRHRTEAISALIVALTIVVFIMTYIFNETKLRSKWGDGKDITSYSKKDLETDWIPVKGKWTAGPEGITAVEGEGNSYILLFATPYYGNMAIEFDAEVLSAKDLNPSADLSIIMAASKNNPAQQGYFLQLGGIGNTCAVIQKRNGLQTAVAFKVKAGQKYHIRAEKDNAQLRLYCDNSLILQLKDVFYREGGHFGLYTFGGGKRFSNIKIYQKELPELVPPTVEGDGFYRESRVMQGNEKIRFLKLACNAYTKVYESHLNPQLSSLSLLKRAYVYSELGMITDAQHDAILLEGFGESLELLQLKAYLEFIAGNYEKSYDIYKKAVLDYPNSVNTTIALLNGQLSLPASVKMPKKSRQSLWRLYAENYKAPVLRCSNRNLESIAFLKGLNFNLIDCSNNKIASLAPLENMNLKYLDCADNNISSLVPLQGMKLISLECHNNPIKNISSLEGMPLKVLSLSGTDVKDILILKKCTTLEKLSIPTSVDNIKFLRNMENLKFLNNKWDSWTMTKQEFFEKLH